jgi:hypothetical protein
MMMPVAVLESIKCFTSRIYESFFIGFFGVPWKELILPLLAVTPDKNILCHLIREVRER